MGEGVTMAKKKRARLKIRIPLPAQTEKVHSVKKGAKGYNRRRARNEVRAIIRDESSTS